MNSEDMSDVFEKLNNIAGQNNVSPDMVNNLFNMLNNSNASNNANSSSDSSNSNDSQSSENNTSGIDIETIMRMKTIMDKMNAKDDPRALFTMLYLLEMTIVIFVFLFLELICIMMTFF